MPLTKAPDVLEAAIAAEHGGRVPKRDRPLVARQRAYAKNALWNRRVLTYDGHLRQELVRQAYDVVIDVWEQNRKRPVANRVRSCLSHICTTPLEDLSVMERKALALYALAVGPLARHGHTQNNDTEQ